MEGERVYDDLDMSVILQNENKLPCPNDVLESLWISSNPSPSNFHGDSYSCSTSMATTEDTKVENQTNMNIFPTVAKEENENIDDCDGSFYQPESKKRRLTSNQVHCLEKSFEIENKLEPDRKIQLAKEIGLQPRQVAIWFQNRRARFKTKQLEKDYGGLKASYDGLKCDYDSLIKEKEKLKAEVEMLKEKLLLKEKEITIPELTQPKTIAELQKQIPIFDSEKDPINLLPRCKQEDTSSANSDVLDSEQSDGEDELFAKSLFHTQLFFPKLEDACFVNPSEEEGYDGNWSFSTECQPSWLWPS